MTTALRLATAAALRTATTTTSSSTPTSTAPLAVIVLMASMASAWTEIALPTFPSAEALRTTAGRPTFGGAAKVTSLIGSWILGIRVLEIRCCCSRSRIQRGGSLRLWCRVIGRNGGRIDVLDWDGRSNRTW